MKKNVRLYACAALAASAILAGASVYAVNTAEAASESVPQVSQTVLDLSPTQRNSINMLNYLTVLMQEINDAENGRLRLEEIYSSLVNNIDPASIDAETLAHLNGILDTLEDHRMLDAKYSRLEFKHEQEQARAVYDALATSAVTFVTDPTQAISSVAQTASPLVSVVLNETLGVSDVSLTADEVRYLEQRMELDDAEAAVLHESRKATFTYTVETVNAYGLPSSLVLTEKAVEEFVAWKNNENLTSRIRFLESNAETYQALGAYWLLLAESYYLNGDYQKCLDAVETYESLSIEIFRKDYDYGRVLTMALAAADQLMDGDEYVELAEKYVPLILANCDNGDWDLRYFAAQAYIDLYAKTGDSAFLQAAYDVVLDNVNYLAPKQIAMNEEYLGPIAEIPVPDGATKEQKKEIENYNKLLKAERETALAPVYEPLLLNCNLLVSIVSELDVSDADLVEIDGVLHGTGACLFLIESLDDQFWFSGPSGLEHEGGTVTYNGHEVRVPIKNITDRTKVTVMVSSEDEDAYFETWTVTKVERETDGDIKTYVAVYSNEAAKGFDFKEGMKVEVQIAAIEGLDENPEIHTYTAVNTKDAWWETAMVWDDGIDFVEDVAE